MKTFYVGIKGVIVSGKKVLILRAVDKGGIWEVPGGRINDNETVEQALRRELLEELPNIQNIHIHHLLDAYRIQKDIDNDISLVLIFYKVTAEFEGNPAISNEHIEWRWVLLEEALELVHDSCRQAIIRAFGTVK